MSLFFNGDNDSLLNVTTTLDSNPYHSVMKILADKYLYGLNQLIPDGVILDLYDPSDGLPNNVTNYDGLLIRTVTKINEKTLPDLGNIKFIGTATAGVDHVDRVYLERAGIFFACSEGCNANAVGIYIITSILKWATDQKTNIGSKKIGVVGCGHTGSSVINHLNSLGVSTIRYDPPKSIRDPRFESAELNELLDCDILTFHTPLEDQGEYPTIHLCNSEWLQHGFDLILNASRGGVVDEDALINAQNEGRVKDFILDVWEGEPLFTDLVAQRAFISTPHIAGYSVEAKIRASEMVIDQLIQFFNPKESDINSKFSQDLPSQNPGEISDSVKKLAVIASELDTIQLSYRLWKLANIDMYDHKLRKLIGLKNSLKADAFAKLRSESKLRTEVL
ncbi:MAG: 4-phosphoerythronate dehydrogenase [Balneolaceae bacterium]